MKRRGPVRVLWMPALLAAALLGAAGPVGAQLPVPVFGQHWELCQEDLFGGINSPDPEYGAAVAFTAMVLRYDGLPTGPVWPGPTAEEERA